ncbi:hypothetical protein ACWD7M_37535, partial [Streptomyces griseus]
AGHTLAAACDDEAGTIGLWDLTDPDTPLEETMGALDSAVRQGKALYVGRPRRAALRATTAV